MKTCVQRKEALAVSRRIMSKEVKCYFGNRDKSWPISSKNLTKRKARADGKRYLKSTLPTRTTASSSATLSSINTPRDP